MDDGRWSAGIHSSTLLFFAHPVEFNREMRDTDCDNGFARKGLRRCKSWNRPTVPQGGNMPSPIVILTAVESGLGFILSVVILYLLLSRKRQGYHYLFAAFLLVCAIWDLGIFFEMIRNDHLNELPVIGRIITLLVCFIPALLFHFACLYTGRRITWAIILVWVLTGILWVLTIMGVLNKTVDVYTYSWGSIHKYEPSILDPVVLVIWFGFNLWACWLMFLAVRKAKTPLEKRHSLYIFLGAVVITFAVVKVGVALGINLPFLLPLGMFLIDVLNAIIGVAIIKDRLFDITVIVKKGTLFSLLAAVLIFVYSFVEHILVTFIGERVGENSALLHLVAVAVGIAVLMPLKNRIEKGIEHYFARRTLQF
jgi:hypothetical protein